MVGKRLILLLLTVLFLPLGTRASAPLATEVVSECPAVERPQWRDVGLCDVLAVSNASTVVPPTTVRVVHDSPSGTTVTTQTTQMRHGDALRMTAIIHRRPVSGYIYMIRCLRL